MEAARLDVGLMLQPGSGLSGHTPCYGWWAADNSGPALLLLTRCPGGGKGQLVLVASKPGILHLLDVDPISTR